MAAISRAYSHNSGQFRKGQSGNPAGRPRGARNKATLAAEALCGIGAKRLTREVVERALDSGDPALLRFCLMHLLPPARRRPVVLNLGAGRSAEAVAAALAAIVRAIADGIISPLEARDIARSIAARRPTVETGDLERRLAVLERVERESAAYAPCPSPASRERGRAQRAG